MSNINEIPQGSWWYSYLNLNTKNFNIFNENTKSVTLTQGHARDGDGADKNFRPISTTMPYMNEIHQRVFKIWGLINFNTKTLTLWLFYENSKSVTLFPRSPRGGDGADKNFRPISTIMPYMNKIHQRVFKIRGLINFNAKTLTLWRKDKRTNERTNERTNVRTNQRTNGRTEKRKLYTPTYFVCQGYNNTMPQLYGGVIKMEN